MFFHICALLGEVFGPPCCAFYVFLAIWVSVGVVFSCPFRLTLVGTIVLCIRLVTIGFLRPPLSIDVPWCSAHCLWKVVRPLVVQLTISPSLLILGAFQTPFPIPVLGMGGDLWMHPLGPIAPEGATWMHFPSVAAALHHLHSPAGGSLKKLQHPSVTRAAKSNATRDGWAFTMEDPSLVNPVVAAPSPSPTPSQLAACLQPLTPFFWLPCRVRVAA